MPITATVLKQRIAREIEAVADERVRSHVRSLLVQPVQILRDWDYGKPGEQYACWSVLNLDKSKTGIA